MHPYPPYDALVLVAEQCPECMQVLLGLYSNFYDGLPLQFKDDRDGSSGAWKEFLSIVEHLHNWQLLRYEFIACDRIEVTLPEQEILAVGKILC